MYFVHVFVFFCVFFVFFFVLFACFNFKQVANLEMPSLCFFCILLSFESVALKSALYLSLLPLKTSTLLLRNSSGMEFGGCSLSVGSGQWPDVRMERSKCISLVWKIFHIASKQLLLHLDEMRFCSKFQQQMLAFIESLSTCYSVFYVSFYLVHFPFKSGTFWGTDLPKLRPWFVLRQCDEVWLSPDVLGIRSRGQRLPWRSS